MILTSNAYAPDGRLLQRGQTLPEDVGKDFAKDIDGILVANDAHPLLTLPVGTEEELDAAWRRVHEHDVDVDALIVVAADRVRHAAVDVGAHRIARLRPFVDELPPADETEVQLHGTSSRGRRARS